MRKILSQLYTTNYKRRITWYHKYSRSHDPSQWVKENVCVSLVWNISYVLYQLYLCNIHMIISSSTCLLQEWMALIIFLDTHISYTILFLYLPFSIQISFCNELYHNLQTSYQSTTHHSLDTDECDSLSSSSSIPIPQFTISVLLVTLQPISWI